MELEQLLSFVRYQRGQKQGWDALDEVLTAVVDADVKVKEKEKRAVELDKVIAVKEAAALALVAEAKKKAAECVADQDAYAQKIANSIALELAAKDAELLEKQSELLRFKDMIAGAEVNLKDLGEELALAESDKRAVEVEYKEVKKAIEELKAKLR